MTGYRISRAYAVHRGIKPKRHRWDGPNVMPGASSRCRDCGIVRVRSSVYLHRGMIKGYAVTYRQPDYDTTHYLPVCIPKEVP